MSIKNVSFIGLGVMGYPMAGHLQNNGYNVTVYNRTTVKAEKWVEEYKGSMAKTPGKASQNSEIVFMCVGRCLLYTSPSPRDRNVSRMPSSA